MYAIRSYYVLGARPRQQLYAQLFGCVAGALAIVPMFNLLIPDVSVLGSQSLPAPAAQVWAGVSKVMATGLSSVPESARWAALWAALAGALLTLGEKFAPAKVKPFIPSPTGLGIARITSYNVCYTKLLRGCGQRITGGVRLATAPGGVGDGRGPGFVRATSPDDPDGAGPVCPADAAPELCGPGTAVAGHRSYNFV